MTKLVRLGHGLHRPSETVAEWSDRIAAYLDVLPPGAVVGGLTAARLHGLWLPEPSRSESLEFVLTRPRSRAHELSRCRRPEILTHRRTLRADEIVLTDRFPIVSVARTWVDLCQTLSLPDVVAAGDSALRGLLTAQELDVAVREAWHRRGVVLAREALPLLNVRSRSRGESHLRCALVLGGLPCPEVNRPIHTAAGEWLAEPDLIYRAARLVLEYNGRDHADVDRMRKDITREIDVDTNKWKVVVFGPNQVFGHPYRIAPYVRGMLDQRDPGWSRRLAG